MSEQDEGDLDEVVVAVGGGAVWADAGAATEAEDVLVVLLEVVVRGAAHEEALLHQRAHPPGPHPNHRSVPP